MKTKEDVIRKIYEKSDKGIPLKTISGVVETFLDVLSEELNDGNEVHLGDFGTFSLSNYTIKTADNYSRK